MTIPEQLIALSKAATVLIERGAKPIHASSGFPSYLQLASPAGLEGLGIVAVGDRISGDGKDRWFKAQFMDVTLTWPEPMPEVEPVARTL